MPERRTDSPRRAWPCYQALWRWHFYAGLLSIPFILWLSVTGSIYLFRPQIEAWLDRPYEHFELPVPPVGAALAVRAALIAVPGATLQDYELPATPQSAARVIVNRGGQAIRVYVHPVSADVLKIVPEDERAMNVVFRLHGELLMGNAGSAVVELAASWAIILIVTGICLWWPRDTRGLGGILYPRLRYGRHIFWRDIHAATGIWVSCLALFLLLTGLPWAAVWGNYLNKVRELTGTTAVRQEWPVGAAVVPPVASADTSAPAHAAASSLFADAFTDAGLICGTRSAPAWYQAINQVATEARRLALPPPVLISPPAPGASLWTVRSDTQNRPQRVTVLVDPDTGTVVGRETFGDQHLIDRIVGVGVAAHEGQLFGWPNQLLGVLTACSLVLLSVSAVVLWWRRRPAGMLGAPPLRRAEAPGPGFWLVLVLLGVCLPLFAISAMLVKLVETLVLRRIPSVRTWLGLA